jgi:hypothetical protein
MFTTTAKLPTAGHLIETSRVVARFLMVGDIVQDGDRLHEIASPYLHASDGWLVFSTYNQFGGIETVSFAPDAWVPLFDEASLITG